MGEIVSVLAPILEDARRKRGLPGSQGPIDHPAATGLPSFVNAQDPAADGRHDPRNKQEFDIVRILATKIGEDFMPQRISVVVVSQVGQKWRLHPVPPREEEQFEAKFAVTRASAP